MVNDVTSTDSVYDINGLGAKNHCIAPFISTVFKNTQTQAAIGL